MRRYLYMVKVIKVIKVIRVVIKGYNCIIKLHCIALIRSFKTDLATIHYIQAKMLNIFEELEFVMVRFCGA